MLERIKSLCNASNISLRDLEQAIGIGKNSIYKWDSQSPAVKYVALVARYFAVSVDYLIGDEESAVQEEETALIAKFRRLSGQQKEMILSNIDFLLSQNPVKKESAM